jgi:uncharacterized membrane protein
MFTTDEQEQVRKAIEKAEKQTSGEIRVCVEKNCSEEILDRAAKYFYQLEMDKTKLRHGVLIYLAIADRKFAIIGDAGINSVVPDHFWDSTKEAMLEHFKQGDVIEGILKGINLAGEQLKAYFPYSPDDHNELPDDIAFMDGD